MKIVIARDKVMGIVEGISVTISQMNGENASFEQLWASEDERLKLDIYYREAISDLETKLTKWIGATSSQFSLDYQPQSDFTLRLSARFWPNKLEGLLSNKVQDYFVHAIIAGWLNNISGLQIKADYASMAAQDLEDIRDILSKKSFNLETSERQEDELNDYFGNKETVAARRGDSTDKDLDLPFFKVKDRRRDNAPVIIKHDTTDWSGEHEDKELLAMIADRPIVTIIKEPVTPTGKRPVPHWEPPCNHRTAPFEMPSEDPNNPENRTIQLKPDKTSERPDWEY